MYRTSRYLYVAMVLILVGMSALSPVSTPVGLAATGVGLGVISQFASTTGCPNATAAVQAMVDGPGWTSNIAWTFSASGRLTAANGSTDDVVVRRSATYTARLSEDSNIGDNSYYQWYNANDAPEGIGTINDRTDSRHRYANSNDFFTFDSISKGSGASTPAVQRLEFDLSRCVYSFDTNYSIDNVEERFGTNPTRHQEMLAGFVRVKDIPIPEPRRPTDKLVLGGFARVRAPLGVEDGTQFDMGYGFGGGTLLNVRSEAGEDVGTADVAWEFSSQFKGRPPALSLDKELLERSVFLDKVTVDDQFDANIVWGDPRQGYVTWKVGNKTNRVGKTGNARVSKNVDVGAQGVGRTTLTVQAQNTVGQPSRPETTLITVAPPPDCSGPPSTIKGLKLGGGDVNYKFNFKFPEPVPFKAQTERELPEGIPFFGGGKFGIEETQFNFGVDIRATGEGYATAGAKTGLAAMRSSVTGEATGRADLILDPGGVHVQKGEMEFKIAGKLKSKEPLLKLITPMGPVVAVIERVPGAKALVDKASVQIELEPKIAFVLKVKDKAGCLQWDGTEARPGMGIKASLIINIVPKKFEVTVSVGGEGQLYLGVPEPYFRGAEVKFLVGAKVFLYKYALEGEKAYNARFGGQQRANAMLDGTADAMPAETGTWTLMDQRYLTAADYGLWTGTRGTNATTDQQLVANAYPLAHPSFAIRPDSTQEYLVWAHDKGGSNPQGSDELMYARGTATDWSTTPSQLTNDAVSDLNPVLVPLGDGNNLVVWERFDAARPGDINNDMDGYFSHMQVAAGTFWPTATAPQLTPLQLSTSGTLNHGPQAGALTDGAMAIWINNAHNKLLGDTANPDTLMWSRYTTRDRTWTAAAPLAANIAGLRDVRFASNGNHAAVVWSQDMDGDLTTVTDQELFYATWQNGTWSSTQRLTTNSLRDSEPLLQLSESGAPILIWQQGNAQRMLQTAWNAPSRALPFQLDEGQTHRDLQRGKDGSLALTWQELEGNDRRVGYAVYDGTANNWSTVQTVTPPASTHDTTGTTALVSNVSPLLVTGNNGIGDTLAFAYQLASMQPITKTVNGVDIPNVPHIGLQQLRVAHLPLGKNLRITPQNLAATPLDGAVGTPTKITARIENTGGRSISGGIADLLSRTAGSNSGGTVVASQPFGTVAAGATITTTFTVARPASAEQSFVVRVTPDRGVFETDFIDNEARLGTELTATALATDIVPAGVIPQARIERHGLPYSIPVTATLRLDDPTGPIISTATIKFPDAPTMPATAMAWIPKELIGTGRHLIFWDIDPNQRLGEQNRSDNEVVSAVHIAPDLSSNPLMVTWDKTPGTSKSLRMVVRNDGNATARASIASVWTGDPADANSKEVARIDVPAIRAGESAEVSGTLTLSNLPAATTGLTSVYVRLDAGDALEEINENNNLLMVGGVLGGSEEEPSTSNTVYLPLVRR